MNLIQVPMILMGMSMLYQKMGKKVIFMQLNQKFFKLYFNNQIKWEITLNFVINILKLIEKIDLNKTLIYD